MKRSDCLIITNNPMAVALFGGTYDVRCNEKASYRQILVQVRDLVYIGHRLRNHPLYGSLRPHETPYRSVIISAVAGAPDSEDALIMSEALRVTDTFTPADSAAMSEKIRHDYQLIDCELLQSALSALN